MPSSTAVAPRSSWIARPSVDLVIGCGGWSLPLLALAFLVPSSTDSQWASMFYTLALVANYPIILKFGETLALTGDTASARTQYELAARMAEQTGLPEFAAAARQRLGDGR